MNNALADSCVLEPEDEPLRVGECFARLKKVAWEKKLEYATPTGLADYATQWLRHCLPLTQDILEDLGVPYGKLEFLQRKSRLESPEPGLNSDAAYYERAFADLVVSLGVKFPLAMAEIAKRRETPPPGSYVDQVRFNENRTTASAVSCIDSEKLIVPIQFVKQQDNWRFHGVLYSPAK